MKFEEDAIESLSKNIKVSKSDLKEFLKEGSGKSFSKGESIFYESAPRLWIGVIFKGNVTLTKGKSGKKITIGSLTKGAVIGESILIDELTHNVSANAYDDCYLWIIKKEKLENFKIKNPRFFNSLIKIASKRISFRLRETTSLLINLESQRYDITNYRTEKDSLGEREISNALYYGIHTVRAIENFDFSSVKLYNFEHLVNAFVCIKKSAAKTNYELGVLDEPIYKAIYKACDKIKTGFLHEQFSVDMIQGGAGTSSNMNVNEVIANYSLELLGYKKGDYSNCHPNDHVNRSQSTNDVYPTAIKIAIILSIKETSNALLDLKKSFEKKSEEFESIIKMGRTENQDAVPMTLGQEFAAYATMINKGIKRLKKCSYDLMEINIGATAIGTGINSPKGYAQLCTEILSKEINFSLRLAENLVEATQDSADFASVSASLKTTAIQISKICNDLRWASSGPRCGLNEINLPPIQAGSSIMPGKINPVIPEVVNQICYQIIGSDLTVSIAAEASEFELNMAEPIIAYNILNSMMLLKNAAITLSKKCVDGITANKEICDNYVKNSIGIITALTPKLGYEKSTQIAKEALKSGKGVYDLILEKKLIKEEELTLLLSPEKMSNPLIHN